MKERTFIIVLFSVIALCALLTAAHLAWDIWAYNHSSVIYFVSKELW